MKRPSRWSHRLLTSGLFAILVAGGSGCLNCFNPVPAPPPEMAGPCHAMPPHVRRHVHVFLMNGVDPLGAGNLSGLRDHVQRLGFTQTYYGQFYHESWLEREMLRVHQDDPDGRFVLIGYGWGARTLQTLGQKLAVAGAAVDVLLALDVSAEDMTLEGPFAVQMLPAPSRPETVAHVAWALGECASRVTVVESPQPTMPEQGPTPRPVKPFAPQSFGPDWDSLKPATQLH
jgi:hypothetical protein